MGIGQKLCQISRHLDYFICCCWWIATASALDAGLAVYFKQTIRELEENPVCAALIEMEPQWMSLFLAGKFLGTCIVIFTTMVVYRMRRHLGITVATALSVFQGLLIGYQLLA